MRTIERSAFKLSSGGMKLSDFEAELYTPINIDLMNTDELLYQLIGINFKGRHWKGELDSVLESINSKEDFLLKTIYLGCQQLIEVQDFKQVEETIYKFGKLNVEYDYEYDFLMEFYRLDDEIDLLNEGYGSLTKREILKNAKYLARVFVDAFNEKRSFIELLDISEDNENINLQSVSKNEMIEYIANEKIDFKKEPVSENQLEFLGYTDKEIKGIFAQVDITKEKILKSRVLIYSVLGTVVFFVGYKSLKSDHVLWLFIYIGTVLLVFSLIYVLKLLVLKWKKRKHKDL